MQNQKKRWEIQSISCIYSQKQFWSLSFFYLYQAFLFPSDLLQEHRMLLHFFYFQVCKVQVPFFKFLEERILLISTLSGQGALRVSQLPQRQLPFFSPPFLSQDPYFRTNEFLSEHHSQVNSLLLPVLPSHYCSNTGFPKSIQIILSMVSPYPLFSYCFIHFCLLS